MTEDRTTAKKIKYATFAGGCFWCMVPPFDGQSGVIDVISGYTGGHKNNPTYEEVCIGTTGHYEAVQITYDPSQIAYRTLLDLFWRNINPTDGDGQFYDRGQQYATAIFYHDEEQKAEAVESKKSLEALVHFDKPIATKILPAEEFFPAEDYHQGFYKKNSQHYERYKISSGRDDYLKRKWISSSTQKKTTENTNKDKKPYTLNHNMNLSPLQYKVTQENFTEPPFQNEYWDNKDHGIYVDVVSGEPLFSSLDKFDSGSGWPSFIKALEDTNIIQKEDMSHNMKRTEIRSKDADSHLGHLFGDGPEPTGLRYCINSAALRFIPVKDLDKEGYSKYKNLFK